MRRGTIIIVLLLSAVLLTMWYVALHGEPPSEEVEIDQSVTDIRPLDGSSTRLTSSPRVESVSSSGSH